jgi:tetratricopeptide (TPR) repeat protein
MRRATLTTMAGVLAALFLAGCNGPTKTGIENREAAWRRVDSMNAELTYDQAWQAFEVGDFDHSLQSIDATIQRIPDSPKYHVLRGRIMLETHRLEEAIASFMAAIEHDPEYAEAHYFAGIVFQRWSDDEQAYEHYIAAAELDDENVQYLLAASESLVALGEFEQAKTMLGQKLSRFEHNAAMHHLLGQIAMLQGDPVTAARELSEAHLLRPEDNFLMEELARVQYEAADYAKCMDTLANLQRRTGGQRYDLVHLEARSLAMMGRAMEARDLYVRLSRVMPEDPNVWVELGALAWELGNFRRVAQCSVRVMAVAPERFEGYMLKGVNERHHGNLDEAIILFQQAASRAPDVAMPHVLLGLVLEQKGQLESALAAYDQAIQIDPGNQEAMSLRQRASARQVTSVDADQP